MSVLLQGLRTGRSVVPCRLSRCRLGRAWWRSKSTANSPESSSSTSPNAQVPPPRTKREPSPTVDNGSSRHLDIPSTIWYRRLGPVAEFLRWFHSAQTKRPYTVQLCTSLTVYLTGDLLAQDIGGEPYDSKRTIRMLTIGAIAAIPGYNWLGEKPVPL